MSARTLETFSMLAQHFVLCDNQIRKVFDMQFEIGLGIWNTRRLFCILYSHKKFQ